MFCTSLLRALVYPGSLCWEFSQQCRGSLLSTQEAGGDEMDWGDDATALQITVLEAGTQGECVAPCNPGRGYPCVSRSKEKVHCQDCASHTVTCFCFQNLVDDVSVVDREEFLQ